MDHRDPRRGRRTERADATHVRIPAGLVACTHWKPIDAPRTTSTPSWPSSRCGPCRRRVRYGRRRPADPRAPSLGRGMATGAGRRDDGRVEEEAWRVKYVLLFVETDKFERDLEAMS